VENMATSYHFKKVEIIPAAHWVSQLKILQTHLLVSGF